MKNINENIDLIKWAFEKGYKLGRCDGREGVYIDFTEIQRCFLDDLVELKRQNKPIDHVYPRKQIYCS